MKFEISTIEAPETMGFRYHTTLSDLSDLGNVAQRAVHADTLEAARDVATHLIRARVASVRDGLKPGKCPECNGRGYVSIEDFAELCQAPECDGVAYATAVRNTSLEGVEIITKGNIHIQIQ